MRVGIAVPVDRRHQFTTLANLRLRSATCVYLKSLQFASPSPTQFRRIAHVDHRSQCPIRRLPGCGANTDFPIDMSGQKGRCTQCGTKFVVPAPPAGRSQPRQRPAKVETDESPNDSRSTSASSATSARPACTAGVTGRRQEIEMPRLRRPHRRPAAAPAKEEKHSGRTGRRAVRAVGPDAAPSAERVGRPAAEIHRRHLPQMLDADVRHAKIKSAKRSSVPIAARNTSSPPPPKAEAKGLGPARDATHTEARPRPPTPANGRATNSPRASKMDYEERRGSRVRRERWKNRAAPASRWRSIPAAGRSCRAGR